MSGYDKIRLDSMLNVKVSNTKNSDGLYFAG